MKNMKLVVLWGIASMSSLSFAGLKRDETVSINSTMHEALGSIGSARNSDDSNQYIGCSIEAEPSTDPLVSCFARDAADTTAICTSTSPRIVAAVQKISSVSFIDFQWDPTTGECTFVYLNNSSVNPPPGP